MKVEDFLRMCREKRLPQENRLFYKSKVIEITFRQAYQSLTSKTRDYVGLVLKIIRQLPDEYNGINTIQPASLKKPTLRNK